MKLSVIIPAYNRERTVGRTVESVLACGTAAQVIVVDDGSTDGTVEAARAFGARITVATRANAGPAAARNTGAALATGDVFAFLDSDDEWLPGVVPDCLRILQQHPDIDVLFCETLCGNAADGYRPISETTGRGRFGELLTTPLEPELFAIDRTAFARMMIDRNQVFLGSAFIRRGVLEASGLFDPALFGGEDYELCLRLAVRHRFAFLVRPLARYKKHPGGLSANPDRMAREFALAMRAFLRLPDLTPAERTQATAAHRRLSFEYAYRAYDRGDLPEARLRFARALRHSGMRPKTLAFWLLTLMPPPLVRAFRSLKRGVTR